MIHWLLHIHGAYWQFQWSNYTNIFYLSIYKIQYDSYTSVRKSTTSWCWLDYWLWQILWCQPDWLEYQLYQILCISWSINYVSYHCPTCEQHTCFMNSSQVTYCSFCCIPDSGLHPSTTHLWNKLHHADEFPSLLPFSEVSADSQRPSSSLESYLPELSSCHEHCYVFFSITFPSAKFHNLLDYSLCVCLRSTRFHMIPYDSSPFFIFLHIPTDWVYKPLKYVVVL